MTRRSKPIPFWKDNNPVRKVWNLDGGKCWLCGMIVPETTGIHPLKSTRDHVVPIKNGGNRRGLVRLAHNLCNSTRGHDENFSAENCKIKIRHLLMQHGYIQKESL